MNTYKNNFDCVVQTLDKYKTSILHLFNDPCIAYPRGFRFIEFPGGHRCEYVERRNMQTKTAFATRKYLSMLVAQMGVTTEVVSIDYVDPINNTVTPVMLPKTILPKTMTSVSTEKKTIVSRIKSWFCESQFDYQLMRSPSSVST